MSVIELAQIFSDNYELKRYEKAEHNILMVPTYHESILNSASNESVVEFLRQSLVYLLTYCPPDATEFGGSIYTIFEWFKQLLFTQPPYRFSTMAFLGTLNWFSRYERLEHCVQFLFKTNRTDYALLWLQDISNRWEIGLCSVGFWMEGNKMDIFAEATKASFIYIKIETKLALQNDYDINFNETIRFLVLCGEWRMFKIACFQQAFCALVTLIRAISGEMSTRYIIRMKSVVSDILELHRQYRHLGLDVFATIVQYLRITKKLLIHCLNQQTITMLLHLFEVILKQMSDSEYTKLCKHDDCKRSADGLCGLHEAYDVINVLIAIFKGAVEKEKNIEIEHVIITDPILDRIGDLYAFGLRVISGMNCDYALNTKKKALLKVLDLKCLCDTPRGTMSVIKFLIYCIQGLDKDFHNIFQLKLFEFLLNTGAGGKYHQMVISIGFIMILNFHEVTEFAEQKFTFARTLVKSLEAIKCGVTPIDFLTNQTSLTDYNIGLPIHINPDAVLEFFRDLFVIAQVDDEVYRNDMLKIIETQRSLY